MSCTTLLVMTFLAGIICYFSKSCLKLSFFEIQNSNCLNKVWWRNDQNKSCGSWWVLQICGLWLFRWSHLLSKNSVIVLIFWNSNFELFKQTHIEKRPKPKLWILMSFTTFLLTTFSFEIIFDILEFNTFLPAKENKKRKIVLGKDDSILAQNER